nr:transporter substrate-binding domain-containing protein [uncultured Marinifilum sp.]
MPLKITNYTNAINTLSVFRFISVLVAFLLLSACRFTENYKSGLNEQLGKNGQEIEILFGYEAPPNAYHNEKGEYVGLLVDFQKEIESQLNYKFKTRHFNTWSELINYSKTAQNFVIVGIAASYKRKNFLSFTNSFVKIPYVIVTKKNSPISSMDDLKGKKVCIVSNYTANDYIEKYYPEIIIHGVKNDLEGLRGVISNTYDAMIINQMYASFIIEEQGITNLKIEAESGYMNRLSAATSINDQELFKLLDWAVDQITIQKQKQLFRKWVYAVAPGTSPKIKNTIIIVLTILVFCLILLWIWLTSLRRIVRRQTHKLQESELKYRKIIESSYDAIYIMHNGQLQMANQSFINMFGYSQSECKAQYFLVEKLIHPSSRAQIVNRIEMLKRGETPANFFEICGQTKSGVKLDLQISENYFRSNNILISQGIIRDISQQKKDKAELIKAKDKAEESDRLKSAFLANMSHEIRTPMNAILGFTNLLKRKDINSNKQNQYINIIEESSTRMLSTINDLVDISKIESGQMELDYSEVDLNVELQYIEQFFLPEAKKKNINLIFNSIISDTKPIVISDKEKLSSIITNLIKNAIKYTNSGTIEFSYTIDNNFLKFKVSDTGIGIDKAMQDKIFNRFIQADHEATKVIEGSGLGLAICKAYVEMLGGKIWVESEKNKGSQFYFTHPIARISIQN